MKKRWGLAAVIAVVVACSLIGTFLVCPLPDFTVTVDGFAEQKVMGGRFLVITPLEPDYSYIHNDRMFPRFRYISVNERMKIKSRLDYFTENAGEEQLLLGSCGLPKLVVETADRKYVSLLDFGVYAPVLRNFPHEPDKIFVPNGYSKDDTYDGAVELWVELTRSNPFFSTERSILLTNTWVWLYGDRCVGVEKGRTYNNLPRDKIVKPNKLELFIENLAVRYVEKYDR